MLQLNCIRSNILPDPLWRGKIICRQYVQGYCNYGNRCKYDHPSAGNPQWFDPQQPPQYPQAEHGEEIWVYSTEGRYFEEQSSDISRFQSPLSGPLGNGAFSHAAKSQFAPPDYIDPKKIRSMIAWKTTPCKHFVRNNGWCPLGDACNFIHDWQLVSSTLWNQEIIRKTAESPSRPGENHRATSHCWAHVQGFCGARSCPHFHPADIQPYIKYTPCPAWILCDRRSTCPFKHCDTVPSGSQESMLTTPPPSTLPIFYPSLPPPPAPVTYTAPAISTLNPVEVNGTTYFPLTHEASLSDSEYNYLQSGPIAVPVPIPLSTQPLSDLAIPTSLSPLSTHQRAPTTYQPCSVEPSFFEQAYVNEPPLPLSPPDAHAHSTLSEDTKFHQQESMITSGGIEPELKPPSILFNKMPKCKTEAEPTSSHDPVDPDANEDRRRKRKLHSHARRISINVKTGEVVERTSEGRHGVYELGRQLGTDP